jgi:hypothetical protein
MRRPFLLPLLRCVLIKWGRSHSWVRRFVWRAWRTPRGFPLGVLLRPETDRPVGFIQSAYLPCLLRPKVINFT